MVGWKKDHKKWTFNSPGLPNKTSIWVSGAVVPDDTSVKPKLILEETHGNAGYSIQQPGILEAAIKSICDELGMKPEDCEWYAVGRDDEFFSIEVTDEMAWRPSPEWQQLANSGDLDHKELEKVKKVFPDEYRQVITATWSTPENLEAMGLIDAFDLNERQPSDPTPSPSHEQAFNLSKEYFQRYQPEAPDEAPFHLELEDEVRFEATDTSMSPEL